MVKTIDLTNNVDAANIRRSSPPVEANPLDFNTEGSRKSPLKRKRFDFPDIPPTLASPLEARGTWYLASLRPKLEHLVVDEWKRRGLVWCIPKTVETTRHANRTRHEVFRPIFAGLFPCCAPDGAEKSDLFVFDFTRRLVKVTDQISFQESLWEVWKTNRIAPLDPYPFTVVGKKCRVRWGPFEGCVGTVVERDLQKRIVVLTVGQLGGAAIPFSFDPSDLEPLEGE